MSPIGKGAVTLSEAPASFVIFPDLQGHWRARKSDGLVAGTFRSCAAAVRFAKAECVGLGGMRIVVLTGNGR